jgi:hypothetical protein
MAELNKPVIIIPAYNRPNALRRLLNSISIVKGIGKDTLLIISIDHAIDNQDVIEIANSYEWEGKKVVIVHEENMGLRGHILWCGDQTEKYGAVIILEDDLLVSPLFYSFAQKALSFYSEDAKSGGISLYSYNYCESVNLPFYLLKGSSDVYFMQYASSWGQAWTWDQWAYFKNWYKHKIYITTSF